MSEPRGAIPKLIIFIFGLIFGILLGVPSPIDVGVMILEAIAKAFQPLNVEQANQIVSRNIIFLRMFGWVLIIVDVLGIYLELRKGEYF